MITKSLIGQFKDAPLCKYKVFDDGKIILEHKTLFQQYLHRLDPESLLYCQIDIRFGISFHPIKIDMDNIVIIVNDRKAHHYNLSSQQTIELTDIILIKNRHCYHDTQLYEESQCGIRVIEFKNYPHIQDFIIDNEEVQDFQIINYSNTKMLKLFYPDNSRKNYHIPIFKDNIQVINEEIKQSIHLRLSDSEQDKISSYRVSNDSSIQYRLGQHDYLKKVIYSDKFMIHYNNQHRFSKCVKYVRVFQIMPKAKIIRKFRNQSGYLTDYSLQGKQYILGYFDRKHSFLYKISTAEIIEEICQPTYLTNDFLFEEQMQNVNVYRVSIEETLIQETK